MGWRYNDLWQKHNNQQKNEVNSAKKDHFFFIRRIQHTPIKLNNVKNVVLNDNKPLEFYQQNEVLFQNTYKEIKSYLLTLFKHCSAKTVSRVRILQITNNLPALSESAIYLLRLIWGGRYDYRIALRIMTMYTLFDSIQEWLKNWINVYFYYPIYQQNSINTEYIDNSPIVQVSDLDNPKKVLWFNFEHNEEPTNIIYKNKFGHESIDVGTKLQPLLTFTEIYDKLNDQAKKGIRLVFCSMNIPQYEITFSQFSIINSILLFYTKIMLKEPRDENYIHSFFQPFRLSFVSSVESLHKLSTYIIYK